MERVLTHLEQKQPGLSPEQRQRFASEIADRTWSPPVSLGKAVGIILSTHVRHELTEYDQLLRQHHFTREEARLVVKPEHDSLLQQWAVRAEDDAKG